MQNVKVLDEIQNRKNFVSFFKARKKVKGSYQYKWNSRMHLSSTSWFFQTFFTLSLNFAG